ncbi:MAG: alpha-mannosidase [bacterium]|nr:alpha-mannosidase [bacterium]
MAVAGCAAHAADGQLAVSHRVHAFYYPWYANPETDGAWSHWNHSYPDGAYNPPDQIGANFYPAIGLYSSNSRADVTAHMEQLKQAGVGVISTSWWGKGDFTDKAVPLLLDVAAEFDILVNFHIEPRDRDAAKFKDAVKYIIDTYGNAPAFYRDPGRDNRPLFYVYDSYLTPAKEWATVLAPDAAETIRGTQYDADVIALYVKKGDESFVETGHFDGFYSYFAVDGFVYGSTIANWPRMAKWARENDKLFIPSVGPGYIDTRIRPWNDKNTRGRESGAYYDRMWQAALAEKPRIVSITSFNEWHEGSQIAPVVSKAVDGFTYLDYRPREPEFYLTRTREWVKRFDKGWPPAIGRARPVLRGSTRDS